MNGLKCHADSLVGAWSLIDYRAVNHDESTIIFPLGENAQGILLYLETGMMSAHIMRPGAPTHEDDASLHGGLQQELAVSMRHSLAYSGSYTVHQAGNIEGKLLVSHHVAVSSFPNWVGTVQNRLAEVREQNLILEPDRQMKIQVCVFQFRTTKSILIQMSMAGVKHEASSYMEESFANAAEMTDQRHQTSMAPTSSQPGPKLKRTTIQRMFNMLALCFIADFPAYL